MLLPLATVSTQVADKVPADAWLIAVAVLALFIVAFVVRRAVKMMMILLILAIAGAAFAAYRFGLFG
ncbi:MAG: hypothetical protein QOH99_1743 [Frankiaceae bacterium]|jgi:glucan phosphoethanolaminetransferase (alkaline phosphatase superfamily)|nr:hypothetical protein [Frankiaceae bacterium]